MGKDGSLKDMASSWAWSLLLKSGRNMSIPWETVSCSGPVDGEPEGNSSTRAELFAIASVLRFFTEFIKYHAVNTSSTLYIWSDSTVAIKRVQFIKEGSTSS